jgi:hypothetical protein
MRISERFQSEIHRALLHGLGTLGSVSVEFWGGGHLLTSLGAMWSSTGVRAETDGRGNSVSYCYIVATGAAIAAGRTDRLRVRYGDGTTEEYDADALTTGVPSFDGGEAVSLCFPVTLI